MACLLSERCKTSIATKIDTPSVQSPLDDTPSVQSPLDDTPSVQTPLDDTPSVQSPIEETQFGKQKRAKLTIIFDHNLCMFNLCIL